jgi:hemerythrin
MALVWSSALALGVPEMDGQHRELFRRLERLEDAILAHDRTEAPRLLTFLRDHVREHFAGEEALMRTFGYPELEPHVEEHRAFAREIENLERTEHGNTAALVLRLDLDVTGWVRDHIYGSDVALARFLAAHRRSTRPGDDGGNASQEDEPQVP